MTRYPISALFPQADDKTQYAKSLGYNGSKAVYVLDGKVISHRSIDWFEFCSALRKKRYKLPDAFSVLVWHRTELQGTHQSILLRTSSAEQAMAQFNEILKRPAHCRSFNQHNKIQLHGPNGFIEDLKH